MSRIEIQYSISVMMQIDATVFINKLAYSIMYRNEVLEYFNEKNWCELLTKYIRTFFTSFSYVKVSLK